MGQVGSKWSDGSRAQEVQVMPVGTSLRYQENPPKQTVKRDGECGWVYRHARYMPKAHSRITLELTDVRVQRVQEISEEDAGRGLTAGMGRLESTVIPIQ